MSKLFYPIIAFILLLYGCASVKPPSPYGPCPTPQQVRWQRMEMNMFCHFGPNTFSGLEWGEGTEPEDLFNPTALDCHQWAATAKSAGMNGIIVTAKHHDGFCLWPNPVSTHTVAQSKWHNGQGDVLRDLSQACREAGVKMGVYISPWDRNAPDYGTPAYNETFRQTLHHALSNYGDIFEQWFDGANGEGPSGRKQQYDWPLFNSTVAKLQPQAVIFSDVGPGCHWMGNEQGVNGETCWSLLDTAGYTPGAGAPPLNVLNQGNPQGSVWIPAETDVSIRPGWFYHANEQPKSLQELLSIYYTSVGRNSLLLLNVPPDTRGLIPCADSLRLVEFRSALDSIFGHDLAQQAKIEASHTRGNRFRPEHLTDTSFHTYWAVPDSCRQAHITLHFDSDITFNRVMIQEYIPLGQRVEHFSVETLKQGQWVPLASATTIGYKRILQTPRCTTHAVRITLDSCRACPVLNRIGLFLDNILVPTPIQQEDEPINITDFGAIGDGQTLNTHSIQAAIDSASARYHRTGKQTTVWVPAGQFTSGSLYLKSGVALMLDSGATLLGSLNPFDYVKDPYCRWTALLFAVKQHDISITGKGTIDCRGWEVANNTVNLIHLGLIQDPLKYDRPNETNRPENIHFRECDNVTVRGITLRNPASWNQQYDQCRHLLIEDQTVDSKSYWNNDGVDIVDCSDVVIRNCNYDAADDAFCFKSHSKDGLSENILVENCVGRSSANGIKFGTVTRGIFRHFRFRNIFIYDTYRSAFTAASVDGAIIEDVVVDSLRSINTGNPFFLRLASRNTNPSQQACLRNIVIKNLYAEVPLYKPDAGYSYEGPIEDQPRNISPAVISGTPGMHIQNITLQNAEIVFPGHTDTSYAYRGTSPNQLAAIPEWERRYPEFSMWKELPAWGLYLRHTDSITLDNVTLRVEDTDYRPAIVADDVNGLTLRHTLIDERKHQPNTDQLVANNVTGLKKLHSTISTRQQKGTRDNLSGIDASATTSDLITSQNNSTPYSGGATLYKASLFGCKSNGTTMNTSSIQFALDYIASHGGGTLVFEVGRYLTGSLQMRANVNIRLNEGAILVGSASPYDYAPTPTGGNTLLVADPKGHMLIDGLGCVELSSQFLLSDNPEAVSIKVLHILPSK
ncbi:MAG: alpha-L-fucosidase [Bacteroidales bacterium]|nr:alpha-L-fucosidase [Bacteroidales bacterium]